LVVCIQNVSGGVLTFSLTDLFYIDTTHHFYGDLLILQTRLLTLTSYPFRIFHATETFACIAGGGREDMTIIGEKFYDVVHQADATFPGDRSLATPSTLLGTSSEVFIGKCQSKCHIQVQQVFVDLSKPDQGLLYYAVSLIHRQDLPQQKCIMPAPTTNW
jgi:hypothetical protein